MGKKIILSQTKRGQFYMTFPKALAQSLEVKKGSTLSLKFNNKGGLILKKYGTK